MVKPLARRLLAIGFALPLFSVNAYGSTAGTVITNTASLSFDVDGTGKTVSSNTARIILAERLDVTVAADAPGALLQGTGEYAVRFRVANTGNGSETFSLEAATGSENASVIRIAADVDDNGIYDPQVDSEIPSSQLSLVAGKDAPVFVIVGGVTGQTTVSLTAKALTGNGEPGTSFDGLGDGGGDAFVGQTGAAATAQTIVTIAQRDASLIKTQAVAAPDGSTRAMKGAVITYTLEARFAAPIAGVEIEDPIPAGTTYVAGSLSLDGAPLTDAADNDAGRFDGNAIKVVLGDVATGNRSLSFKVTIQ